MLQERFQVEEDLPLPVTRQIDALCDEFEAALRHDGGFGFESYLDRVDPRGRGRLLEELALLALARLGELSDSNPLDRLQAANPAWRDELARIAAGTNNAATAAQTHRGGGSTKASGLVVRCPYCRSSIELVVDASLMDIECKTCGGRFSLINESEHTREAAALTNVAHFELIERLGMGEFGTVWKARDTMLDRTVALKIPRREQLDAVSIEKFMREARAAAQLQHPNIISTHEVGRQGDTLYIVNEYVRGVPLSELIADHRLGVRQSVSMMIKAALALEHAHQIGVIHRDLKPSNILIGDDGEPYVMDFGLAKRNEREITITTEGAILGTPAYMSPEQARGEGHHVDGRSDVYSLGVILFQLLTGELPFRGSVRMLLQKVINDDPPGPRTLDGRLPKDLDTICLKCLEKDPARRYATAGDLAADLQRFMDGEPVVARRLGRWGRGLRWARRNPAIALLLAATLTTLLAATIVSSYFAWHAAQNALLADQKAKAATDTLYQSLVHQMRLTREVREQGYGKNVRMLVDEARALPTALVDHDELRRQLVLSMGDFVAYDPVPIGPLEGEVTAICLSRNGQELLVGLHVGLNDGRVVIFDATSGAKRGELEAFDANVRTITVSASDDRLVAADARGAVRVWQRRNSKWEMKRTFDTGLSPFAVAASSDAEVIIVLGETTLEAWDTATGTKMRSLPTEPDWTMRNAAIDVSRRRVAAGYHRDAVDAVGWALWDLDTGERLHKVEMPSLGNTYANGIDLARDGSRLAIGFDEALLVYELAGYEKTNMRGFDSIKAVAFSPTDPYLAAANIRGWVTLWNSSSKRELATLNHPRRRTSRDDLCFSADGTHVAASNAESVRVWHLTRPNEKTVMSGHAGAIPCATFHPNGRLLATGGKDEKLRLWDPSTGQVKRTVDVGAPVQALAYSADGALLAVGCMGAAGGRHLKFIDTASNEIVSEVKTATGQVHSLAWAEELDERLLAGCGENGVALWKISDGVPVQVEEILQQARHWCLATVLSSKARLMIWTEDDWHLKAWDIDAARNQPLHAPPMLQGWHGLALLPDGESIVYVAKTGQVEVWNVVQDRRVGAIGKSGTFNAPHIALSPDGKWLAALTQPDAVSVWHRPTGKHVFSLRPEVGTVWSMAWDHAGEQLAVGQSEGGLAVWHIPEIQKKLAESGLDPFPHQ